MKLQLQSRRKLRSKLQDKLKVPVSQAPFEHTCTCSSTKIKNHAGQQQYWLYFAISVYFVEELTTYHFASVERSSIITKIILYLWIAHLKR